MELFNLKEEVMQSVSNHNKKLSAVAETVRLLRGSVLAKI